MEIWEPFCCSHNNGTALNKCIIEFSPPHKYPNWVFDENSMQKTVQWNCKSDITWLPPSISPSKNCYKMDMQTLWPIFEICLSIVHSPNRNLAHSNSKCLQMLEIIERGEKKLFHQRFLCVFDYSWLIMYTFVVNCIKSRLFHSHVSFSPTIEVNLRKNIKFLFRNKLYYEWI